MSDSLSKFTETCANLPPPGCGQNLHNTLLTPANHGVHAGLSDDEIFTGIRQSIPAGGRIVPDSEIRDAIDKARSSKAVGKAKSPRTKNATEPKFNINGQFAFDFILNAGTLDEAGLIESSPVRISENMEEHPALVLNSLYTREDMLFIGSKYSTGLENIRTCELWLGTFASGSVAGFEHIIPNPLTGVQGNTADGKPSFRSDNCVKTFRFAVMEFDNKPMEQQIRFWSGAINLGLPVAALIHSGGKSIHAWIRVDCKDVSEWESEVENKLFAQIFNPMGVDASCRNESRLSRMPGVNRADKGAWQRLIYLNPEVVA